MPYSITFCAKLYYNVNYIYLSDSQRLPDFIPGRISQFLCSVFSKLCHCIRLCVTLIACVFYRKQYSCVAKSIYFKYKSKNIFLRRD